MSKRKAKAKQLALPPAPETPQQKQDRVAAAGKALSDLLHSFRVALNVSKLDISSGKIRPQVDLIALD
jgi:hypothetical protein